VISGVDVRLKGLFSERIPPAAIACQSGSGKADGCAYEKKVP
jgi:hypothetical protein